MDIVERCNHTHTHTNALLLIAHFFYKLPATMSDENAVSFSPDHPFSDRPYRLQASRSVATQTLTIFYRKATTLTG